MTDESAALSAGDLVEGADAAALAELWQEAAPSEPLEPWVIREKLVEDPEADPALRLAATHGGRLIGAAAGVVRRGGPEGPTGFVQFLAVLPAYRRRGVARRLLDELERRLAQRGAVRIRAFGGAPSYLWPGVDVRYTPALCLFESRGYRVEGYEFNMAVDLTRPLPLEPPAARQAALARMGVTVRALTPDDEGPLHEWLQRTWGPNWAFEGMLALRRPRPSGVVAVQHGRIVGFAVFDSTRPGWFGPMGVEPGLQGGGIGVELCAQALQAMAERGYPEAQIAWAGPRCFYARKLGAVISRVFARMVKPVGP